MYMCVIVLYCEAVIALFVCLCCVVCVPVLYCIVCLYCIVLPSSRHPRHLSLSLYCLYSLLVVCSSLRGCACLFHVNTVLSLSRSHICWIVLLECSSTYHDNLTSASEDAREN
ncbi:hypothetical protein BCR44DRAFT_356382 [Catenaria anguillulae PL171]|uniref:Uncharacterized protein n=1 Tax=Catenaria anguillulae PL171 TaxID=765915 RepID=A0A1Y2I0Y4_9FUNG|nr:hypothetical protein BCR44DRAFT_356382 [Catenaria anguillulae PL171]